MIRMFETWARSFHLVKQSYAIFKSDKEMVWFPIISMTITFFVFLSFIIPLALMGVDDFTPAHYAFFFLYYIVSYFIIIFFNVGLISSARIRLQGGDPTFKDGITEAKKHIGRIFLWAVISATVGLLLRMLMDQLQKKSELLAAIVTSLLGMMWTLLTFFVIPVMIFENKGVFEAITSSGRLFKKTWGETVVGSGSLGLIFLLLGLLGIIPVIIAFMSGSGAALLITVGLIILYWVFLGIMSSTLNGIFVAALYQYATTGKIPVGFDAESVQQAFVKKHSVKHFSDKA